MEGGLREAAVLEQAFRMGRLEVVDADLAARNMGRDREHSDAAAVAIEQPVDEMKGCRVRSFRHRRRARPSGGPRRRQRTPRPPLAHVDPVDLSKAAKRVAKAIEAVDHHAGNAFHANLGQR
jgi:hypothetical protein